MQLFGGNSSKYNEKPSKFLQFIDEKEYLKISLNILMFPLCLIVTLYGYHMSMFRRCQIEIKSCALDFLSASGISRENAFNVSAPM